MKNVKKEKVVRHGEVLLRPITSLPSGLAKADTDVIMNGSGGNDHKIVNGDLYFIVNGDLYFRDVSKFVFGYLVAKKGAKLLHKEHGTYVKGKHFKECPLEKGVYELRRQVEDTHDGMKVVID